MTAAENAKRSESLREIINDLIVRRAAGEVVTDESVIEQHPDLMPELAAELRNLRIVECAEQDAQSVKSGLHIRCPHCHNPVELVDDASLSDVLCPSCGSQFSLVDDSDRTYQARSQQAIGHGLSGDRVVADAVGRIDLNQLFQDLACQFLVRQQVARGRDGSRLLCDLLGDGCLLLAASGDE